MAIILKLKTEGLEKTSVARHFVVFIKIKPIASNLFVFLNTSDTEARR